MPGPWDILDSTPTTSVQREDLDPNVVAELSALGRTNQKALNTGAIDQEEYERRQAAIAESQFAGPQGDENFGLMDAIGYVLNIPTALVANGVRLGIGAVAPGEAGITPGEFFENTFSPGNQVTPLNLALESDLNIPTWAKYTIGFAGELLADPFTYIGGLSIANDLVNAGKITKHVGRHEFANYIDDVVRAGKLPASITEAEAVRATVAGRKVLTNRQLADLGIGRRFKVVGTTKGFNLPKAKLTGDTITQFTGNSREAIGKFITRKAAESDGSGVLGALFTTRRTRLAQGLMKALDSTENDDVWRFVSDAMAANVSDSLIGKMAREAQASMDEFIASAPDPIRSRFAEIPSNIREVIAGTVDRVRRSDEPMYEWLTSQVKQVLEPTGVLEDVDGPIRELALREAFQNEILVNVPEEFAEQLGNVIDITPYAYVIGGISEVSRARTGMGIGQYLNGAKVDLNPRSGGTVITPSSLWSTAAFSQRIAVGREMAARFGITEGLIANVVETSRLGRLADDVQRLTESTKFAIEGAEGTSTIFAVHRATGHKWLLDELETWVRRSNAGDSPIGAAKRLLDEAVADGAVIVDGGVMKVADELLATRQAAFGDAMFNGVIKSIDDNLDVLIAMRNGGATELEVFQVANDMGVSPQTIRDMFSVDLSGTEQLRRTVTAAQETLAAGRATIVERMDIGILAKPEVYNSTMEALRRGEIDSFQALERLVDSVSLDYPESFDELQRKLRSNVWRGKRGEIPRKLEDGTTGASTRARSAQERFLDVLNEAGQVPDSQVSYFGQLRDAFETLTEGGALNADNISEWSQAGEMMTAMTLMYETKLDEMRQVLDNMERTPPGKGVKGKGTRNALRNSTDKTERELHRYFTRAFFSPDTTPIGIVDRLTQDIPNIAGRTEPFYRAQIAAAYRAVEGKVLRMQEATAKFNSIMGAVNPEGVKRLAQLLADQAENAQLSLDAVATAVGGDALVAATDAMNEVSAFFARNNLVLEADQITAALTGNPANPFDEAQEILDSLAGWAATDEEVFARTVAARVKQLDKLSAKTVGSFTRSINDPKTRPLLMKALNKPYNTDTALKVIDGFVVEDGSLAEQVLYNAFKMTPPAKLGTLDKILKPITDIWRSAAIATPGFSFRNFFGGLINNVSYMENPVASYRAMSANLDVGVYAYILEQMTDAQWKVFAEAQNVTRSQTEFVGSLWNKIANQDTRTVIQRSLRETDWIETGRIGELSTELLDTNFLRTAQSKFVNLGRTWDAAEAMATVGGMRRILGEGSQLTRAGRQQVEKMVKAAKGGGLAGFRGSNPTIELLNRTALAIDEFSSAVKGGLDPESAWRRAVTKVDTVHFDYSDLTAAQKRLRGAWVPFIAWRANNTPLQVDRFLRGGWGPRLALRTNLINTQLSDAFQTSWDRDNLILSDNLTLDQRVDPFTDLIDLGKGLPLVGDGKPWAIIADDTSPIAKLLYEIPAGQRASTGYGLGGGSDGLIAPAWQKVPVLGPTMGYIFQAIGQGTVKPDGTLLISSRANYAMNQMLPFLRWGKLVTNDSDPETPETDESLVVNWMNFFGIDVRYLSPPKRAKNIRGQNYELSDRIEKRLRQQGLLG